jgi:chromosome segregation ATPase
VQKQDVVLQAKGNFVLMQEIMNECEGLEMEIARNSQVQAAAREEAAALKKKVNDLKDEVVTAVWVLQEMEAEEEKLRLQIVSSPDRRKAEMLVRQERLRKVKAECSELETAIQQCKTKVVHGKQTLKELEATNSILAELHEEANKNTELVRKIEDTRKKVALRKKYLIEKNDEIEEENRHVQRLDETIISQRKQHTLQMQAAQEALDQAKQRLLNVERERRNGMARVEKGMASVRELQDVLDKEQADAEATIQDLLDSYHETEAKFLEEFDKKYTDAFQETGKKEVDIV